MSITVRFPNGRITRLFPSDIDGFQEFYASSKFIIGDEKYDVEEVPKTKAFLIFIALQDMSNSFKEGIEPHVEALQDEKGNEWNSKVTRGIHGLYYTRDDTTADDEYAKIVRNLFECVDVVKFCDSSKENQRKCTDQKVYHEYAARNHWPHDPQNEMNRERFSKQCKETIRNIVFPGGERIPYNFRNKAMVESKFGPIVTNDGRDYYIANRSDTDSDSEEQSI
eukprot:74126-Prymnesium_polylepis.1